MNGLITSMLHRPYVFIFLVAYLILAWRLWGWRRAIFWLVSGYSIAWLSEYSSIHNGFPYGEYHYMYENLKGELLVAGVPLFDSISYPFLIFAGYTTAIFYLRRKSGPQGNACIAASVRAAVLGAFFTMVLDVIIDPVAKLGKFWFLGEIYYYAEKGWYFNVPFSNFAGWYAVSLAVISANMIAWKKIPRLGSRKGDAPGLLYPLFYMGIAAFSIAISYWIGATLLGSVSTAILCAIACLIALSAGCGARRALP